jgi:hypothetical protein
MLRGGAIGLLAVALLCGCQQNSGWNGSMDELLRSQPERFATVTQDPGKYRVQIIYTQIDRDAENRPQFTSYTYGVNPDQYFYPASTVKLPTALLALEKINELAIPGLTRDSTMLTGVASDWQTPATTDSSSPNGLPSVGHYVRKILLVSDNDAFNRLYEFIGQEPLNESLHEKGYRNTRIFHRLEVARNAAENAKTNPVTFVDGDTTLYTQGPQTSDTNYAHDEPILLGRAEIVDGERVNRPKDFSGNNVFALQDLHDVMQALIFPQFVEERRRFNLTEDDYQFVYRNMAAYPSESGIAEYADEERYPDGYVKFFMYGGSAPTIPENIRIFNKPGDAYGFLTDCAYIVDFENGVEFLLAATIFTNANETFNDDTYEYDEIALPFLRDLGMAIYEVERAREREHAPDLGRFRQATLPE